MHSWRFEALGTSWEIVSTQEITAQVKNKAAEEIALFERVYSRFIGDSFVSRVAQEAGTYTFPESAHTILGFYETLSTLTAGKVTPLIGDTLSSSGYDAQYSLKAAASIKPVPNYEDIVRRKRNEVTTTQPVTFDIGATGKGYMVDQLVGLFLDEGHNSFVVDGSGDMRVVGEMVETVGLENPHNPEEVIGVVKLHNKALCASASNRRAWGEWHHIIDPNTSLPTREIIATWVVADSAMIADGLATALFFVDPKVLATKYTYEYVRVHANGSIEYSDYFAGGIFS